MIYFDFRLDLGYQQLVAYPAMYTESVPQKTASDRFPFQTLVVATEQKLRSIKSAKSRLRDDWSHRMSTNGKFELHAQEWKLYAQRWAREKRPIATLRMVYIRGQKNEIINTWIFPVRSDLMPVYAAELISVASTTRIAFVDIQTPNLNESLKEDVQLLTAPLAAQFSALPCDEPAPSWATEASQGNFTFARQADATWLTSILSCYTTYLDAYLAAFIASKSSASFELGLQVDEATRQLATYQKHHMNSSPGKKFLGTLFGTNWTDSFLNHFLFTAP